MTVFKPSRTVAIEDFLTPKLFVVDGSGNASSLEPLFVVKLLRKWACAVSLSNSSMFRSSPLLYYYLCHFSLF